MKSSFPLKIEDISRSIGVVLVALFLVKGILPQYVRIAVGISGLSLIIFLEFYRWYRGTLRFTYITGFILFLAFLNALLRPSDLNILVLGIVFLFSALSYFSGKKPKLLSNIRDLYKFLTR